MLIRSAGGHTVAPRCRRNARESWAAAGKSSPHSTSCASATASSRATTARAGASSTSILADEADHTIVFCEVKSRRLGNGDWRENLHERKRRQVRKMAAAWLNTSTDRPHHAELRFDAVGVTLDDHDELVRLDHLQDAF